MRHGPSEGGGELFLEERACALNRERLTPPHAQQVVAEVLVIHSQLPGGFLHGFQHLDDSAQVLVSGRFEISLFTQVRRRFSVPPLVGLREVHVCGLQGLIRLA